MRQPLLLSTLSFALCQFASAQIYWPTYPTYANVFIDPAYVLAKNFSANTATAQQSIMNTALELADQGPWSVVNKTAVAPSGDIHDYLSWAPYWWPDCSQVGNKTELTPEEIWTTCPYKSQDGVFNPDFRLVNNTGDFWAVSDAIFYNALSWAINGSETFATNTARFIDVWFVNNDTRMNPNLNYGQVIRGPGKRMGAHTGILDLKCMTKVASAVLILRDSKAPGWTTELDDQLVTWTKEYIKWLESSPISLEEKAAKNNHGTFWYNQVAALKILVGDKAGAASTVSEFFKGIYLEQIVKGGEQPFEAARTRPYHYRAYNLAAMITNAQIGQFVDVPAFDLKTSAGATIKDALDFAMAQSPKDEDAAELYPVIASVAAVYGDPEGKYAAFLAKASPNYPGDPYFLWSQPLSDSGWAPPVNSNTGASNNKNEGGGSSRSSADRVHTVYFTWLSLFALLGMICFF
ncbi:chondroitin AC/alginate lyase [Collybia nuda]|uniref:Chondroitin AC/alginate lyase n=1 Tax=Collybia nuda TaxID=64659 RepID=A0A9P6CB41_9AGAR|nr:chondroitin AC/alginate lyase [Collybia nuda]